LYLSTSKAVKQIKLKQYNSVLFLSYFCFTCAKSFSHSVFSFATKQAYAVIFVVWNYSLPVLIFAYCYGHVFYAIRRQSKVVSGHVGRGQDVPMATTSRDINTGQVQQQTSGAATAAAAAAKLSRTEMNVLKTMIAVIICFIIFWTPGTFNNAILGFTVCSFCFILLFLRPDSNIKYNIHIAFYVVLKDRNVQRNQIEADENYKMNTG